MGARLVLRVDLLEGLAREPDTSALEQVRAWDNSDVLVELGNTVKSASARLPQDPFLRALGECTRRLASIVDSQEEQYGRFCEPFDSRLMKLSRICDHTGIVIDEDPGHALLGEITHRIERCMVDRLKYTDRREFDGQTVDEAVVHVLKKLFADLQRRFDDLPDEERRHVAERIIGDIDRFDTDTQARIREKLDIDRLGIEGLLMAGGITSLGAALGGAVALGGFGAYTALNSAIASVAGLVGLTMPFSVYVFATSTLAFLSNPLTLSGVIIGGGALLRSRVNRAIRDRYLSVWVTLSIIARANPSEHRHPTDVFVRHARRRYSEFLGASPSERRTYQRAFPAFREA